MNKQMKIVFFGLLFLMMLITTIWASFQQNLFTEASWSHSPMWFKATIVDFYINQLILWLWVVWLEPKSLVRFIWLILFVCFGSMGTCAFIIYRLATEKSLFSRGQQ